MYTVLDRRMDVWKMHRSIIGTATELAGSERSRRRHGLTTQFTRLSPAS
jgi:hypothetical protein